MINEEKEQTIWKSYPEYPFIEANQFGEIRMKDRYVSCKNGGKRLIKGRVLKQRIYPNGYMFVHFSLDGKQINLLVHRIVATCFLPNPNNLPVVNHKDNDRANNRLDNLEWCSREYNEAYKKNFGTSQTQVQGHPVFAVNLETGKVLRFESQCEAARQLGVFQQDICKVIKGKLYQTGGYWFTENKNEITEKKIKEVKANIIQLHSHSHTQSVIAIDLNSFKIFYFESQSEAAYLLNVSMGNLSSVINGKLNKTKGFWFTCANETAVEKTRAKFGDEVAKKVEKLMSEKI